MAVTVVVDRTRSGAQIKDEYETGHTVRVSGEHLYVHDTDGDAIGIYAPGKWAQAYVDGATAVDY